jgi:hypothetical protein
MLQWVLDRRAANLKKVNRILLDSFINGIKNPGGNQKITAVNSGPCG